MKAASRVKNHLFSKFAIFSRLNRVHQEFSFKKDSRKQCSSCADMGTDRLLRPGGGGVGGWGVGGGGLFLKRVNLGGSVLKMYKV